MAAAGDVGGQFLGGLEPLDHNLQPEKAQPFGDGLDSFAAAPCIGIDQHQGTADLGRNGAHGGTFGGRSERSEWLLMCHIR